MATRSAKTSKRRATTSTRRPAAKPRARRSARAAAPTDSRSRVVVRWTARFAAVVIGLWLLFEAHRFPNVASLETRPPGTTSFMAYRVTEAARDQKSYRLTQTWAPREQISPHLFDAVLAAEDDRFYEHEGFDLVEIRRAIDDTVRDGKRLRGASTLSQQLAKNLWLSPSRTPLRKARETIYTYALERRLSKDRIIELYVNVAEWGRGVFGAEAAARHYFGVSARKLSRHQAALLAAALPNPLGRNPAKPSRDDLRRAGRIEARMAQRSGLGGGVAARVRPAVAAKRPERPDNKPRPTPVSVVSPTVASPTVVPMKQATDLLGSSPTTAAKQPETPRPEPSASPPTPPGDLLLGKR